MKLLLILTAFAYVGVLLGAVGYGLVISINNQRPSWILAAVLGINVAALGTLMCLVVIRKKQGR
ncbi:MAG: hypothetical protein U0570_00770 [Phycisphaerales bacterium]